MDRYDRGSCLLAKAWPQSALQAAARKLIAHQALVSRLVASGIASSGFTKFPSDIIDHI